MSNSKEQKQVLHKAHVIRWVEFEKQKPNDGDEVIVYNPKREQKQIIVWCSGLEKNLNKDYTVWYFLPPIV